MSMIKNCTRNDEFAAGCSILAAAAGGDKPATMAAMEILEGKCRCGDRRGW